MNDDLDKTDETYDPSELEATRGRQQGLGMGAKDLQRQRDPQGVPDALPEEEDDAT